MEKIVRNKKKYDDRRMKANKPSWSHLPTDLLCAILGRNELDHTDQVRFGAVSKDWMLSYNIHQKQVANKLPTLLTYNFYSRTRYSCQLYDAFNRTPIQNITAGDFKLKNWKVVSQDGWLLFYNERKTKWAISMQMFLLSVATKIILPIPNLKLPRLDILKTITTFSFDPSSQNFLVIVLHDQHAREGKITISTFNLDPKHADEAWISTDVESKFLYRPIKSISYSRGSLYCVARVPNLGEYKVASREWSVLQNRYRPSCGGPVRSYDFTLLQVDEDLFLVRLNEHDFEDGMIWWFDFSVKQWKDPPRSFRNWAIFISKGGSFSVRVVEGMASIISGNRVYYLGRDGGCRVYSYNNKGRKLVYNRYQGSRFNGWNADKLFGLRRAWIQPPHHLENPC